MMLQVKNRTRLSIPDVKELTGNTLLRVRAPDSDEGSLHIVTNAPADVLRLLKSGFTPEFIIKPGVPGNCSIVVCARAMERAKRRRQVRLPAAYCVLHLSRLYPAYRTFEQPSISPIYGLAQYVIVHPSL